MKRKLIEQLENEKRKKGKLYAHVDHECTPSFCNPIASKEDPTFYVCSYRQVHVCTPQTCDALDQGVCRISGACYGYTGISSYDKNDYRTWRSAPTPYLGASNTDGQKKKRGKRHYFSEQKCKSSIRKIIVELLYNGYRKDVNKLKREKVDHAFKKRCETYLDYCSERNVPVNLLFIQLVRDDMFGDLEELPIDTYNLNKILYYESVVYHFIQLWLKINAPAAPSSIVILMATLATLYKMQYGYAHGNIQLLPYDAYLANMLPNTRDLSIIGFDAKQITKGNNLLEFVYRKALANNYSLDDIQLKVTECTEDLLIPVSRKRA